SWLFKGGSGILEDGGGGASRGGDGKLSVNRWGSVLSYDWKEGGILGCVWWLVHSCLVLDLAKENICIDQPTGSLVTETFEEQNSATN
ncbi:hypothetical protein Tco_1188397, partial [Tanacetum coccineum]